MAAVDPVHLRDLEAEAIEILRIAAAECARPVLLCSEDTAGSVLVHLARKAFHPGPLPFPLVPGDSVTAQALAGEGYTASISAARREEGASSGGARIFAVSEGASAREPHSPAPELWALYNTQLASGTTLAVHPLANWTHVDIREYSEREHLVFQVATGSPRAKEVSR